MSGLEAVAHALAGSTGGIVAMTLLYPLENIRTRLQVQVKRKGVAVAPVAPVQLTHTHAETSDTPAPEECISPETPMTRKHERSAHITTCLLYTSDAADDLVGW